jgi:thiosulfate dehydrogenase
MLRRAPVFAISLLIAVAVACNEKPKSVKSGDNVAASAPSSDAVPFRVPSESEIRDTIVLASVRRGRALIHNTRDSLPQNVRSGLNCANCHFADGTTPDAMPLVGVFSRFPQYRGRSGHVDLLEDRINDCFRRSLNGKALDPKGRDMRDMVTYMAFLSRGFPQGKQMQHQGVPKLDPLVGDTTRGREFFVAKCARCHGIDGNGSTAAPPLWGPRSYNIGAGMARVRSAAAFIHHLMPRDSMGTVTPQQAFDVATYINTRPRPDFPGKERDWPHGGAPPDVAYATLSSLKKTESSALKK